MKSHNDIIEITHVRSTSNREIEIKCKARLVMTSELEQYVNINMVEACKIGCPNYGKKWSCPPYAKDYLTLSKKYQYAFLVCLATDMEKYLDIKNKYLAIKAANVTLKTLIEKIARICEEEWAGYALLSGSCRLCKPCNCKLGLPCNRPLKMRYSMEASHLNVSQLSLEQLEHPLQWYQNKTLPEYTTTVSLVLTNRKLGLSELYDQLENIIVHL